VGGIQLQNYTVTAEFTNTKVSGTVGGNIIMQGSNVLSPAAQWVTLRSNSVQTYGLTDTVTAANGNTISMYQLIDYRFKYFRIRYISTGTQRSTLSGTLYWCPTLVKNLN
jgi:hypothetical protein